MAAIVGEKEKGEGKQGTPAPPPPPPPGQSQEQQPGHSFLATLPEIRNMEHSLLALLNSFHAGELSAFGQSKLETMNLIREKQERLARHHFDIGSSKQGDASNWMSETDQNKLVAELTELSVEIEKLHESAPSN